MDKEALEEIIKEIDEELEKEKGKASVYYICGLIFAKNIVKKVLTNNI